MLLSSRILAKLNRPKSLEVSCTIPRKQVHSIYCSASVLQLSEDAQDTHDKPNTLSLSAPSLWTVLCGMCNKQSYAWLDSCILRATFNETQQNSCWGAWPWSKKTSWWTQRVVCRTHVAVENRLISLVHQNCRNGAPHPWTISTVSKGLKECTFIRTHQVPTCLTKDTQHFYPALDDLISSAKHCEHLWTHSKSNSPWTPKQTGMGTHWQLPEFIQRHIYIYIL